LEGDIGDDKDIGDLLFLTR